MPLLNLFSVLILGLAATVSANSNSEIQGPVIGINLGTTHSYYSLMHEHAISPDPDWQTCSRCVGVYESGRVEIIANDQGQRTTPSYIAFTDDEILVGDAAKNQALMNPTNTIFGTQRLEGRETKANHSSKRKWEPEFTPELVLQNLKQIAESYLGQNVTHAVVAVPAYFNDAQRQATRDAGTMAGLSVAHIINEPTAAALAYGLEKNGKEQNILVYDLGGSSFDVSVLTVDDGVYEVLATNGLIEHFTEAFIMKNKGKDPRKSLKSMAKLKHEVERAKCALSSQVSANVEIEPFYDSVDFAETRTRAKLEELNLDLFKKTLGPVETVLKDAGIDSHEIHEIILAGGSTRIPKNAQLLEEFFNGNKAIKGISPDEAVAYSAAVHGGSFADDGLVCLFGTFVEFDYRAFGQDITKHLPPHTQQFSGEKDELNIHVTPFDVIPTVSVLR
ncbi:ATPase with role in protein import into the ER [Chytriomyces hyalinus]|nr:ATPase with role in protein import into the ER [Chytriomyces hyalinus]